MYLRYMYFVLSWIKSIGPGFGLDVRISKKRN